MSEKKLHEAQAPHTAADCEINEAPHNHPDMDCGHYVHSGPGVNPGTPNPAPFCAPDPTAPSSANGDQDPAHGPGVE